MRFPATVKDGKLVIDPSVELPEGATATVLLHDGDTMTSH